MVAASIVRRTPVERNTKQPTEPGVLHANPLVARLLLARGVCDASELAYALKDLPTPDLLPDIETAVARLCQAIVDGQRIMLIGDYDCDGATSTTLALVALRAMGAQDVHYLVPNRFEYGYGLSAEIVDVAAEQKPALIVTVDNGVASVAGVQRANELGIDVLVTDHHLPPESLPKAVAIVNPNLSGCQFAGKSLAGVGVIFYVMLAVRAHLNKINHFAAVGIPTPNLGSLLDLVAIGTVADVVPLDRVNRILVEQGLRRIRAGQTRPGVSALIKAAGREASSLTAADIGFAVGPRLNAAGRLDDIGTGIECLLAEAGQSADNLAGQLNALNQERRAIESEMQSEAEIQVEQIVQSLARKQQTLTSLCLAQADWHQGVVGILAGRLKEQLHIPVIIFAATGDGTLKGSGRSIPGLHIRDALNCVATEHPGMIEKFGGHAMAAGLSLPEQRFSMFRDAFDKTVSRLLGGVPPTREWVTDGELKTDEFTLKNAQDLRFIGPWGQDFPEPCFDGVFNVQSVRELKGRHLKLSVVPSGSSNACDAIAFNKAMDLDVGQAVRLVYRLTVNSYRSRDSVQLLVLYIQRL